MRIFLITLITTLFFTSASYACKCINPDAHELYEKSDIVVLGTPAGELKDKKQYIRSHKTLKGDLTDAGIYLSQQKTSCRYPQLPLPDERTYLFFISSQDGENKLLTSCYTNTAEKDGTFNLRLKTSHANIHASMLKTFFETKGKIPQIDFHISHTKKEETIETFLGIKNLSNKDIEIFDPSNRNAYTFFIIDSNGNLVPPKGSAKVSPKGGVLSISEGGVYNYTVKSQTVAFPYLSNTARFGYELESNKKYKAHVIYRPYGGTYGTISSPEKTVFY